LAKVDIEKGLAYVLKQNTSREHPRVLKDHGDERAIGLHALTVAAERAQGLSRVSQWRKKNRQTVK
jgi:hypothetical protein